MRNDVSIEDIASGKHALDSHVEFLRARETNMREARAFAERVFGAEFDDEKMDANGNKVANWIVKEDDGFIVWIHHNDEIFTWDTYSKSVSSTHKDNPYLMRYDDVIITSHEELLAFYESTNQ